MSPAPAPVALPPVMTHLQNSALQEEKKTLTRNISCLYRTAVEELERKNKQIQQLQQQASGF